MPARAHWDARGGDLSRTTVGPPAALPGDTAKPAKPRLCPRLWSVFGGKLGTERSAGPRARTIPLAGGPARITYAPVRTVVIYATMPVGKVVGEFEVGGVLCEKPKDLWKRTKDASGITREFFDSYFDGREQAMAIAVRKPKRYATPKNLKDVSGSLTPPQSFQYLAAEAEV